MSKYDPKTVETKEKQICYYTLRFEPSLLVIKDQVSRLSVSIQLIWQCY